MSKYNNRRGNEHNENYGDYGTPYNRRRFHHNRPWENNDISFNDENFITSTAYNCRVISHTKPNPFNRFANSSKDKTQNNSSRYRNSLNSDNSHYRVNRRRGAKRKNSYEKNESQSNFDPKFPWYKRHHKSNEKSQREAEEIKSPLPFNPDDSIFIDVQPSDNFDNDKVIPEKTTTEIAYCCKKNLVFSNVKSPVLKKNENEQLNSTRCEIPLLDFNNCSKITSDVDDSVNPQHDTLKQDHCSDNEQKKDNFNIHTTDNVGTSNSVCTRVDFSNINTDLKKPLSNQKCVNNENETEESIVIPSSLPYFKERKPFNDAESTQFSMTLGQVGKGYLHTPQKEVSIEEFCKNFLSQDDYPSFSPVRKNAPASSLATCALDFEKKNLSTEKESTSINLSDGSSQIVEKPNTPLKSLESANKKGLSHEENNHNSSQLFSNVDRESKNATSPDISQNSYSIVDSSLIENVLSYSSHFSINIDTAASSSGMCSTSNQNNIVKISMSPHKNNGDCALIDIDPIPSSQSMSSNITPNLEHLKNPSHINDENSNISCNQVASDGIVNTHAISLGNMELEICNTVVEIKREEIESDYCQLPNIPIENNFNLHHNTIGNISNMPITSTQVDYNLHTALENSILNSSAASTLSKPNKPSFPSVIPPFRIKRESISNHENDSDTLLPLVDYSITDDENDGNDYLSGCYTSPKSPSHGNERDIYAPKRRECDESFNLRRVKIENIFNIDQPSHHMNFEINKVTEKNANLATDSNQKQENKSNSPLAISDASTSINKLNEGCNKAAKKATHPQNTSGFKKSTDSHLKGKNESASFSIQSPKHSCSRKMNAENISFEDKVENILLKLKKFLFKKKKSYCKKNLSGLVKFNIKEVLHGEIVDSCRLNIEMSELSNLEESNYVSVIVKATSKTNENISNRGVDVKGIDQKVDKIKHSPNKLLETELVNEENDGDLPSASSSSVKDNWWDKYVKDLPKITDLSCFSKSKNYYKHKCRNLEDNASSSNCNSKHILCTSCDTKYENLFEEKTEIKKNKIVPLGKHKKKRKYSQNVDSGDMSSKNVHKHCDSKSDDILGFSLNLDAESLNDESVTEIKGRDTDKRKRLKTKKNVFPSLNGLNVKGSNDTDGAEIGDQINLEYSKRKKKKKEKRISKDTQSIPDFDNESSVVQTPNDYIRDETEEATYSHKRKNKVKSSQETNNYGNEKCSSEVIKEELHNYTFKELNPSVSLERFREPFITKEESLTKEKKKRKKDKKQQNSCNETCNISYTPANVSPVPDIRYLKASKKKEKKSNMPEITVFISESEDSNDVFVITDKKKKKSMKRCELSDPIVQQVESNDEVGAHKESKTLKSLHKNNYIKKKSSKVSEVPDNCSEKSLKDLAKILTQSQLNPSVILERVPCELYDKFNIEESSIRKKKKKKKSK